MSRTNRYEEPAAASREDLESAVATGDPTAISRTMVGVIEDDDVDWLTDTLLDLAGHESLEVRATAVTCLGHVARIRGHIDSDRVLSRLRHLLSERPLRGRVDDAIDDIKHFAVHRSHALVTELVNDPRRRPASRRDSLPVPVQLVSGHRAPTTGQERDRAPVARGVRRARSKASEPPTCLGDLARRGSLGCQARSRRDRAGLFPRERRGDGSPVGGRPVRVSNATVAQQYLALCTPDDGFASWNVSMEGHHAL